MPYFLGVFFHECELDTLFNDSVVLNAIFSIYLSQTLVGPFRFVMAMASQKSVVAPS